MADKDTTYPLFGAVKTALEAIGFKGTISPSVYPFSTSATYLTGSMEYRGETIPVYLWNAGTPIPGSFITVIGEERKKEGKRGAIFISPTPITSENDEVLKKYRFDYLTLDEIESKLTTKQQEIGEAKKIIECEKNLLLKQGGYVKAEEYKKFIDEIDKANDRVSKKRSLEDFIAYFARDMGLTDIEVDKKTPSSEIDIYAKNEKITGVWKVMGTPVIFEAKNWDEHVTSDEIRNLALKATGCKTRFMVAWNGISGKDEGKGARLEIIKAKERGIFIIVLTKESFLKIVGGISPELIIAEKYYGLIDDKVS